METAIKRTREEVRAAFRETMRKQKERKEQNLKKEWKNWNNKASLCSYDRL